MKNKNPNSIMVLFRIKLASIIDPMPAPGECWCVNCSVNDGRSLVLSEDGWQIHLEKHSPDDHIVLKRSVMTSVSG
jgi:hypothetical protein